MPAMAEQWAIVLRVMIKTYVPFCMIIHYYKD
jgi:hypothetical protein